MILSLIIVCYIKMRSISTRRMCLLISEKEIKCWLDIFSITEHFLHLDFTVDVVIVVKAILEIPGNSVLMPGERSNPFKRFF